MNTVFDYWYVSWQELPGYTNLIVPIQGCMHKCKGCHSPEYADFYAGVKLKFYHIDSYLKRFPAINSVIFFGGDQYHCQMFDLINKIESENIIYSLYTGLDNINEVDKTLLTALTYVKIGCYIEDLGPLNSHKTNQRIYRLPQYQDQTQEFFWR